MVSVYERPLFAGDSLHELLNQRLAEGKRVVAQLSPEEVLQVDPRRKAEEITAGLGPMRLSLRMDAAHLEPHGPDRAPVLAVPVDGSQEFVERDPEKPARAHVPVNPQARRGRVTAIGPRPRGYVKDGILRCELAGPPNPHVDAQVLIDREIEELTPWIDRVNAALRAHEETLLQTLEMTISDRQRKERDAAAFFATSPLPIRRRSDAPQPFARPTVTRKPTPVAQRGSRSQEAAPVLTDEYYEHILDVIRAAGHAMTRSPHTYAGWGEEDRRQALLLMLNTHYEGQAHAEAFNASGKTDILIRVEDRNVFIAECLIWGGPKHFSSKLDQLLNYATWHDTKLALVVFVRTRRVGAVIETGRKKLAAHPQFARWLPARDDDAEMRCAIRWPGDNAREAVLHVLFVSTPDSE